jgi:hypothetical protein
MKFLVIILSRIVQILKAIVLVFPHTDCIFVNSCIGHHHFIFIRNDQSSLRKKSLAANFKQVKIEMFFFQSGMEQIKAKITSTASTEQLEPAREEKKVENAEEARAVKVARYHNGGQKHTSQ